MTRKDREPAPRGHRLARILLSRLADPRERREILEDFEALRRRRGRSRLWLWFEIARFARMLRSDGSHRSAHDGTRRRAARAGLLDSVARDARHALRVFARSPGITLVAVPTIALSVGATTALFSFADALILRPLDVRQPDRLLAVHHVTTSPPLSWSEFSWPDYVDLRDQSRLLDGLAAWSSVEVRFGEEPDAQPVEGLIVSANYFAVLGVEPVLGRSFTAEEGRMPDTHPVVILSESLLDSRFGGDRSIIGRSVVLNGRPFTVVGVAPAGTPSLDLASAPKLWVPLMMHRTILPGFRVFGTELFGNRGTHWLQLVARMPPGLDAGAAEAELQALARRQAEEYPETNSEWTIRVADAGASRAGPPSARPLLRLTALFAAVIGMVLLIACANVANLLLAKAVVRRREMGVRMAVGASRSRLIRQTLTEALVLAGLGGAAGIILAGWCMRILPSLGITAAIPGLDVRMDARTLAFTLGVSVLTGALFGLVPAMQASSAAAARAGRGAVSGADGGAATRRSLVVIQVALALVLLIGAGLTLRTLWNLQTLPLGFDADSLLLAGIDLSGTEADTAHDRLRFTRILDDVRSLSGVQDAAFARIPPFSSSRMANDLLYQSGDSAALLRTNVDMNVVGTRYFSTLGIPILAGRPFNEDDHAGTIDVAIINDALAARLWPGENAIGRRIWNWRPDGNHVPLLVVGVAANGRYYRSWQSADQPFVFLPESQNLSRTLTLHVRVGSGRAAVRDGIRRIVNTVDPAIPAPRVRAVSDARGNAISLQRTNARLLGMFGGLAALIAVMGVYGVASFNISRRSHEIGVRIALGATPADVRRSVVIGSAGPIIAGSAAGLLAAAFLVRFLAPVLFGIAPRDPATFALLAPAIVAVAILASYMPARRATRVDPLLVLRD